MQSGKFEGLESNILQGVFSGANRHGPGIFVRAADTSGGAIDDTGELGAEFVRATFQQALLCFFGGEPCGMPIRFLRRFEARNFAKVSTDGRAKGGNPISRVRFLCFFCIAVATKVAGEAEFFHPAVNAGFFESFECGGLGVGHAWFSAAFGENPTSAASLNQQEFDAPVAKAVANRGDLLPCFRGRP